VLSISHPFLATWHLLLVTWCFPYRGVVPPVGVLALNVILRNEVTKNPYLKFRIKSLVLSISHPFLATWHLLLVTWCFPYRGVRNSHIVIHAKLVPYSIRERESRHICCHSGAGFSPSSDRGPESTLLFPTTQKGVVPSRGTLTWSHCEESRCNQDDEPARRSALGHAGVAIPI